MSGKAAADGKAARPSVSGRKRADGGRSAGRGTAGKRRLWPRILALVVAVLVLAMAAVFSWNRWLRFDDARDFQGSWQMVGAASAVAIDGDVIRLTEDVAYAYRLDPGSKTLSFTFGTYSGKGRYRFSLDRQTLVIQDGDFSWFSTLTDDAVWTFQALVAAVQGGEPPLPEGDDVVVLVRSAPVPPSGMRRAAAPRIPWATLASTMALALPIPQAAAVALSRAPIPQRVPLRARLLPTPRPILRRPDMDVLRIERMTVRTDRVVADVRVAPDARWSTPAVAARVRQAFPLVVRHACVNDAGKANAVLDSTPLPHVLEHLVIDLQTCAAAQAAAAPPDDFAFVGTSEWTDEAQGRARVEVNFTDDLVALRAFREATQFLNDAVVR